ncbi:MAG: chloride channel protein, partial [Planctomycetota bacterium]|nr:chloride channel protein [Planctomycetota bacterium]
PKRQQGFLMMSGASAGLAAIFSSPGIGALYGLEVPFRRGFDPRPLIQSTIAAVAAFVARALTIGVDPLVPFAEEPVTVDVQLIGVALVLALVCGLGGRLFSNATNLARRWRKQLRPVVGTSIASVILVAMGLGAWLATGAWVTMGPGHVMFDWATASPQGVWILALALVLHAGGTVICVFGGGGGGIFTSLTVTGAMLGCIAAVLLGCPEALYLPLVGGACLLSAAYRIPFAGMMLIIEWGGGLESALLGIVCIWLAQACMGQTTIAPAQTASPADVKHA